jgi:hypothetical protein
VLPPAIKHFLIVKLFYLQTVFTVTNLEEIFMRIILELATSVAFFAFAGAAHADRVKIFGAAAVDQAN